jgi:predicted amidohydrolase
MDRIRVATLQYFIRPVRTFAEFREQVAGLVDTAEDYKCQLVVFPGYFTVQLLALGDDCARARAIENQMYVIQSSTGTVLPLLDSGRTAEIASRAEVVPL